MAVTSNNTKSKTEEEGQQNYVSVSIIKEIFIR